VRKRLLLLALAVLAAAAAGDRAWGQVSEPAFTTASLSGTCGFTSASTNVNPGSGSFLQPRAAVGTLEFNGAGNVTISGTQNNHGTVSAIGPVAGTYSVDADGRTGTVSIAAQGAGIFQFEIADGGNELRFMNTGPVDPTLGIVKEVTLGVCRF
jgi:hypothetical protein